MKQKNIFSIFNSIFNSIFKVNSKAELPEFDTSELSQEQGDYVNGMVLLFNDSFKPLMVADLKFRELCKQIDREKLRIQSEGII